MTRIPRTLVASLALGLFAHVTSAQTLDQVDRGWYNDFGLHLVDNPNYIAGQAGDLFRNWFVFDLAEVTDTITSATLCLEMPPSGYTSFDPTETYTVFDVSTPPETLIDGSGGVAAYDDLGTGPDVRRDRSDRGRQRDPGPDRAEPDGPRRPERGRRALRRGRRAHQLRRRLRQRVRLRLQQPRNRGDQARPRDRPGRVLPRRRRGPRPCRPSRPPCTSGRPRSAVCRTSISSRWSTTPSSSSRSRA